MVGPWCCITTGARATRSGSWPASALPRKSLGESQSVFWIFCLIGCAASGRSETLPNRWHHGIRSASTTSPSVVILSLSRRNLVVPPSNRRSKLHGDLEKMSGQVRGNWVVLLEITETRARTFRSRGLHPDQNSSDTIKGSVSH